MSKKRTISTSVDVEQLELPVISDVPEVAYVDLEAEVNSKLNVYLHPEIKKELIKYISAKPEVKEKAFKYANVLPAGQLAKYLDSGLI